MNNARHTRSHSRLEENDSRLPAREPAGNPAIETLLQRPDLWRGRHSPLLPEGLSTGYPALDARLPGHGWPTGAITELLCDREGIGELHLLLPALAALSHRQGWIAWVGSPHLPYAPALAAHGFDLARLLVVHPSQPGDRLWAMEQILRSGSCGALVGWPPAALGERPLRRLQLAAEEGKAFAFLFRPGTAARVPSPAALRLRLEAAAGGLSLRVLKSRGGWAEGPFHLPWHAVA